MSAPTIVACGSCGRSYVAELREGASGYRLVYFELNGRGAEVVHGVTRAGDPVTGFVVRGKQRWACSTCSTPLGPETTELVRSRAA